MPTDFTRAYRQIDALQRRQVAVILRTQIADLQLFGPRINQHSVWLKLHVTTNHHARQHALFNPVIRDGVYHSTVAPSRLCGR